MSKHLKNYRKFIAGVSTATIVMSTAAPMALAASFPDVEENYRDAVHFLVSKGITGKADGTFGTYEKIKRVDAAVFIVKVLGLDIENAPASGFTDVPKRAEKEVNALKEAGITNGKTETTLGANDPITRGELAKWIAAAFNLKAGNADLPFTDVDVKGHYGDAVKALVQNNITNGRTPTTFGTHDHAKRGDFAIFLYKAAHTKSEEAILEIERVTEISTTGVTVELKAPSKDLEAAKIKVTNADEQIIPTKAITIPAGATSATFPIEIPLIVPPIAAGWTVNGITYTQTDSQRVNEFEAVVTWLFFDSSGKKVTYVRLNANDETLIYDSNDPLNPVELEIDGNISVGDIVKASIKSNPGKGQTIAITTAETGDKDSGKLDTTTVNVEEGTFELGKPYKIADTGVQVYGLNNLRMGSFSDLVSLEENNNIMVSTVYEGSNLVDTIVVTKNKKASAVPLVRFTREAVSEHFAKNLGLFFEAKSGSSVAITITDNQNQTITVTETGTGDPELISVDASDLNDGILTAIVTATDPTGVSKSEAATTVLDRVAPKPLSNPSISATGFTASNLEPKNYIYVYEAGANPALSTTVNAAEAGEDGYISITGLKPSTRYDVYILDRASNWSKKTEIQTITGTVE